MESVKKQEGCYKYYDTGKRPEDGRFFGDYKVKIVCGRLTI